MAGDIETRKALVMEYQMKIAADVMKAIQPIVKRYGSGGWFPDSDRAFYVEDHVLQLLNELFVFTDNPEDQP